MIFVLLLQYKYTYICFKDIYLVFSFYLCFDTHHTIAIIWQIDSIFKRNVTRTFAIRVKHGTMQIFVCNISKQIMSNFHHNISMIGWSTIENDHMNRCKSTWSIFDVQVQIFSKGRNLKKICLYNFLKNVNKQLGHSKTKSKQITFIDWTPVNFPRRYKSTAWSHFSSIREFGKNIIHWPFFHFGWGQTWQAGFKRAGSSS